MHRTSMGNGWWRVLGLLQWSQYYKRGMWKILCTFSSWLVQLTLFSICILLSLVATSNLYLKESTKKISTKHKLIVSYNTHFMNPLQLLARWANFVYWKVFFPNGITGCIFMNGSGLTSFVHPLYKVRAIGREDGNGHICGVMFQVDLYTRLPSIPRTGSATNWADNSAVHGGE